MPLRKVEWKPNESLPMGKGATVQQFVASVGGDRLQINVSPWGEGDLMLNGVRIGHVKDRKNRRQAFADLKKVAEHHMRTRFSNPSAAGKAPVSVGRHRAE